MAVHEDYTECERVRNLCLYPVHLSALVLVGEDDELADDAPLKLVVGHDGEDETGNENADTIQLHVLMKPLKYYDIEKCKCDDLGTLAHE